MHMLKVHTVDSPPTLFLKFEKRTDFQKRKEDAANIQKNQLKQRLQTPNPGQRRYQPHNAQRQDSTDTQPRGNRLNDPKV